MFPLICRFTATKAQRPCYMTMTDADEGNKPVFDLPRLTLGAEDDDEACSSGEAENASESLTLTSRHGSMTERLDASYVPKRLMIDLPSGGKESFSGVHLRDQLDHLSESQSTSGFDDKHVESRVLVLHTGGSIGMQTRDGLYETVTGALHQRIASQPHLHDHQLAQQHYSECHPPPFVMPRLKVSDRRIVYWVVEYEPLLDSSEMTYDDWIKIAKDIKKYYHDYDAFVVLHGTDTMAYTASALSFMLDSLGKPVVLTGSQAPMNEVRSDGRENLAGALLIAAGFDIPEVTIYFNRKLYRGNRTSKWDSNGLEAFRSPNFAPLASLDLTVTVNTEAIFRAFPPAPFSVHSKLNRNVASLLIFPSISIETVMAFLKPPMEGVVLHSYGAGNCPTRRLDILQAIKRATDAGIIIVICSQCAKGMVSSAYAAGKILADAGAISGADMTPEAALIKLAYVLGNKKWSLTQRRRAMMSNLRGELTGPALSSITFKDRLSHLPDEIKQSSLSLNSSTGGTPDSEQPSGAVSQLVRFLRQSTANDLETLKNSLFPALACAAAARGDLHTIEALCQYGYELRTGDHQGRTPLHVAAQTCQLPILSYLLAKGANVHIRLGECANVDELIRMAGGGCSDFMQRSPLEVAIREGHMVVVDKLLAAGAHLATHEATVGRNMCLCVAQQQTRVLECWLRAQADVNSQDYDGRTPLHVACSRGHVQFVRLLLQAGASTATLDSSGRTPVDCATLCHNQNVLSLLCACPGSARRDSGIMLHSCPVHPTNQTVTVQ